MNTAESQFFKHQGKQKLFNIKKSGSSRNGGVFYLEKKMTPGSSLSQIFNYKKWPGFLCFLFIQQERIDIGEKYANLQEEAAGKTKKLKKVWSMLMSAKSEVFVQHTQ